MKVAFSTDDGIQVNAHFGQSPMFAIYEVTPAGIELLEHRQVLSENELHEAGKIASRIRLIEDCVLVFLVQIGASAAAQVTKRTIMPVKVAINSPIEDQLQRLQQMLLRKPPMWLAKILHAEKLKRESE